MKIKTVILAVLLVSVFVAGCGSKSSYQSGYAAYNQPAGQQQGQYVGGGCGVAPSGAYESTPTGALSAQNPVL